MLSITDWDRYYETHRTRLLKKLDYVIVRNKQDGDGYTELMEHPQGAMLLGAWIAILQVASKCSPRGNLARSDGKRHDSASLSRISRVPTAVFDVAIPMLLKIGWLQESCDDPAFSGADLAKTGAQIEEKRREEKGREQTRGAARRKPDARLAGWNRFEKDYPGIVTEMDLQIWLGIIETDAEEELLFLNLPLWKSSEQWREVRYIPKAENFLSKRLWKKPPPKSSGNEISNPWPDLPRYAKGEE